MIRWVFRPFTQLWASICTSERPSDLHLFFNRLRPRHVKIIIFRVVSELISLRSFKKIRTGRMCQDPLIGPFHPIYFHYAFFGFYTIILSTLMHSLIRVSRRDIWRASKKRASPFFYKSIEVLVVYTCSTKTDNLNTIRLSLNSNLHLQCRAPFSLLWFPGNTLAVEQKRVTKVS